MDSLLARTTSLNLTLVRGPLKCCTLVKDMETLCVAVCSVVSDSVRTSYSPPGPLSTGLSGQNTEVAIPPSVNLPDPGTELWVSCIAVTLPSGTTREALKIWQVNIKIFSPHMFNVYISKFLRGVM